MLLENIIVGWKIYKEIRESSDWNFDVLIYIIVGVIKIGVRYFVCFV